MPSSVSSTRWAWMATTSPAPVRRLARPWRSTSLTPTAASSRCRCFVAEGCPIRHATAAAEIDPWRRTSTRRRSRAGSRASTMPSGNGTHAKPRLAACGRQGVASRRLSKPLAWSARPTRPGGSGRPRGRGRIPGPTLTEGVHMRAAGASVDVDVDVLRAEIRKTYTDVSSDHEREFVFPTGRAWAQELAYPEPELSRVPDATVEGFAGVANHWLLGRVQPGEAVLDLGCGAGTDLLVAAQMAGPTGRAIGVDMTTAMLERAAASARAMGLANVELQEALIERLPLGDGSFDVVISNGVIDLVPDKDAVLDEIDRVLRPGGRLQLAEVVIHTEVSEDARARIDLWTG